MPESQDGSYTPDDLERDVARLKERIDDLMEAVWYAGARGHPAPKVSKSFGAERGDILRMVRAALKRARR